MPSFEDNPNSLRETLESVVTQVESAAPAPAPTPAATPAPAPTDTPPSAAATPAAPAPYLGTTPPADASTPPAPTPAPTPDGKPQEPPKPGEQQQQSQEPPKPGEQQPDGSNPYAKAPGTWTPAARESWANLPQEVKQEVWKREREASRALTMSTEARRFQSEFERTMQPYLGFIAAENSTPLNAVNYMMQTAAALRVGTPQQKVNLVAGIIKQYGIDLQALDSVLAGEQAPVSQQQIIENAVQQAVAPIVRTFQSQQQMQEQQLQSQVDNDILSFVNAKAPDGSLKHEFFMDVQDVMADIVEVAQRRGVQMGLTEAYERAIMMHEPVRRVIEARKQRQSAQHMTTVATQAQGAAASITPSSEIETATPVAGNSIRASIEAAINAQQGR